MAVTGTGLAKRNETVVLIQIEDTFHPLGKNVPDMSRALNNTVEQNQDVLGNTNSTVAPGNQITSVTPYKIEKDSAVGKELYAIYKEGKTLDELKYTFIEIFLFDEVGEGKCAAFQQEGKIDLKSWGGNFDSLYAPFDIVWEGPRTQGSWGITDKSFTPEGETPEE